MPPLATREANLFKQVLRNYEDKQYKKGLRTADQILKKCPDHGETLSMKGLILNCLEKKEEAYDFVKRGLKNDLKSHICWHVYGLLHRSDKNYEEAIKCYRNALKIDKDNLQILRDLSLLQIQLRNLEGYLETRHHILKIRPQQKPSWVGLAIAYHLQKNYTKALEILGTYENTLTENDPNAFDVERSEFLLYKNQILIDNGKYEEALAHLDKIDLLAYDGVAMRETRANLYFLTNKLQRAENAYRDLIAENPENVNYYHSLAKCKGLVEVTDNNWEDYLKLYDSVSETLPKAHCPKRLALYAARGEALKTRMDEYLRNWLKKGAPSLFCNIKQLCANSEKLSIIEQLTLGYTTSLKTEGKFNASDSEKQPPTALLFTLYFLAQLYDYQRETEKALNFINEAIAHTPTVVEVVQARARIYKHAGDLAKAQECINQARELDLQDRFINTKCTKYMIRNNNISEAENTISLFTKGEAGEIGSLVDLQCMWYAIETGLSHYRQRQYGKALKKFHQVEKHFNDFVEDQFDFHTYCLRKMTLRAYISMIHYEDEIRKHKFFFKAANAAIQCYLDLYDKPKGQLVEEKDEFAGLSEEERKKAINKQRKAEAKAKEKAVESQKNKKDSKDKDTKPVDTDPDGLLYEKTEKPLEEAVKFLIPLLQFQADKIQTHVFAAEIYLRKQKPLAILRALKHGYSIDKTNGKLHLLAVKYLHIVQSLKDLNPVVESVIKEETEALLGTSDPVQLNASYLQAHPNDAVRVLSAVEAMIFLQGDAVKEQATSLLSKIDPNSDKSIRLETAIQIHQKLVRIASSEASEAFKVKCQTRFKNSTHFHGSDVNAGLVIRSLKSEQTNEN